MPVAMCDNWQTVVIRCDSPVQTGGAQSITIDGGCADANGCRNFYRGFYRISRL